MYTRVFESILDSSLNVQSVPASARWLWITMLLIADKSRTGIVDMPIERLAARAGLSVSQTNEGLSILCAPDPESRSDKEEGRRLVPIRDDSSRGWRLVNYDDYAALIRAEQQREQTRARVAAFRQKKGAQPEPSASDVTLGNDVKRSCNGTYEYGLGWDAAADEKTQPEKSEFFAKLWTEYPSATGKARALKAFAKSVKTEQDRADIVEALRRYKLHLAANTWKHPQNGSTWFGNWRDWVTFTEETNGNGGERVHGRTEGGGSGETGGSAKAPEPRHYAGEQVVTDEMRERWKKPVDWSTVVVSNKRRTTPAAVPPVPKPPAGES